MALDGFKSSCFHGLLVIFLFVNLCMADVYAHYVRLLGYRTVAELLRIARENPQASANIVRNAFVRHFQTSGDHITDVTSPELRSGTGNSFDGFIGAIGEFLDWLYGIPHNSIPNPPRYPEPVQFENKGPSTPLPSLPVDSIDNFNGHQPRNFPITNPHPRPPIIPPVNPYNPPIIPTPSSPSVPASWHPFLSNYPQRVVRNLQRQYRRKRSKRKSK